MASPVTSDAASEHSQATDSAISSGVPSRADGLPRGDGRLVVGFTSPDEAPHHGRVYDAGADGVDPDAVAGVLQRGGLGQPDHRVLAGDVGRQPPRSHQPCRRSGVDDGPAALRHHLRNLMLQAQPNALEIDVYQPVPVVFGVLMQTAGHVALDAGVVVGAVQPPVGRHHLRHQRRHVAGAGNVGVDKHPAAARLLDGAQRLLRPVGVHVGHHDGRALPAT